MGLRVRAVCVLVLLFAACADPPPSAETARVRAHLEGALAEVSAHAPALTSAQRGARARALADLRAYIDAEAYPTNDVMPDRTPIFIDRFGARCAMAALIEASGHADLVARIARDHRYARIVDLAGDAELGRWLVDHGLTLEEAQRIQPSYANIRRTSWGPTASIIQSAELGLHDLSPAGAILVGARLGLRRITQTVSDCDECVYKTVAFFAEYERRLVATGGARNIVGAYAHYDLRHQAQDHQWYALGGLAAELGDDAGLGAKVGLGFSLRNRQIPILGEIAVMGVGHADAFDTRLAVTTGLVW